ncbi:hypothetical protein [Absidia glauca]|uniref:Uncharacterized protein n=1 Tax=Absidia glauca TaxID=4829 RepID=A0A168KYR7_ABSGL|nr:hypothetical protein [Absidia glauca]
MVALVVVVGLKAIDDDEQLMVVIDVDGLMITTGCCEDRKAAIVVVDVKAKNCLSRNQLGDAVVGGGGRCLLRIDRVHQIILHGT